MYVNVKLVLQGQLDACNSLRDCSTLYQSQTFSYQSDYDTLDKSIQSSRHVDVFKVWLMWRAKGPQGYQAQIEQLMDLSRYDSNSNTTFCLCLDVLIVWKEEAMFYNPVKNFPGHFRHVRVALDLSLTINSLLVWNSFLIICLYSHVHVKR